MLAIRMQRTGRKGHANFRVVVQDSRQTPSSGKVVALLGTYNPHTKTASLAKDRAEFYLTHGAHPSDRVAKLLKEEGVKLPKWVEVSGKKKGEIRNVEKLRRNRPADAPTPQTETSEADTTADTVDTEAVSESPVEETSEQPAAPEPADETPAPEAESEAEPAADKKPAE